MTRQYIIAAVVGLILVTRASHDPQADLYMKGERVLAKINPAPRRLPRPRHPLCTERALQRGH
jgi:hypothetical protein